MTARGLEFETAFAVTNSLRLNLNGAYNRAVYTEFTTTLPDISTTQIADYSDKQLHGAPKVILNYGVDYTKAFGAGYALHLFVNNSYRSKAYLAVNLSENTLQEAYNLVDGGIGIEKDQGKYELTLVVKNLLDEHYATGKATYSGTGAVTEQPGYGRAFSLAFRARL